MLATLTAVEPDTTSPWQAGPPTPTPADYRELAAGVGVLLPPPSPDPFAAPRWHAHARCRRAGLQTFFGDDDIGDRPTLRPSVLAAARRLCHACPVARTCLTHALTTPEHYGIWAGTSGRQRAPLIARVEAGEPVAAVVDQWLASA